MKTTEIRIDDTTTLVVMPRKGGGCRLDSRVKHSLGATIFEVAVMTQDKLGELREALAINSEVRT